ncbi:hypothetical protein [Nocardia asteroides]|uniref:hypothetical protein n=1 Tax=Nocardia asteroides TaxID=1824 RepID=UPI0033E518DB
MPLMVVATPPIPQQDPPHGDPLPPRRRVDWFNVGAVVCASTAAVAITIGTGNIVTGLTAGGLLLNAAKMLRR